MAYHANEDYDYRSANSQSYLRMINSRDCTFVEPVIDKPIIHEWNREEKINE